MALNFKKKSDLLTRIKKGEQAAFEDFYNEEFEKIYRFVVFKIGQAAESEEIIQDVFFSFWEQAREGKKIANPRAFLYKIARNKIIDSYRKRGVRPKVFPLDSYKGSALIDEKISDKEIEQELDTSLRIKSIEKIIEELPDDYRDALAMRFIRELEIREIAEVMDKTEGATRVMICRALKLLKKIAEEKND